MDPYLAVRHERQEKLSGRLVSLRGVNNNVHPKITLECS